jgi:hypothetical protein
MNISIPGFEKVEDLKGECNGWNLGYLILTLGVTLILVGALFYYVKQRIEVLETSQKEQIHIMQSFIASIGDQFQRMNAYIQTKLGLSGSQVPVPPSVPSSVPLHDNLSKNSLQESSRIDISESSDSDSESYDSDSESDSDSSGSTHSSSASSNTTRDSYQDRSQIKQIKIHDIIADPDNVPINSSSNTCNMDNIKVIELNQIGEYESGSDEPGSESESESESGSESDSDSEPESESESGLTSKAKDGSEEHAPVALDGIHVTKLENNVASAFTDDIGIDINIDKEVAKNSGQKKTLTIDLDENKSSVSNHEPQYSTLSIKQLRQLLKKKTPLLTIPDISKMKREAIIEMLQQ